jgi:hypothetical protein
VFPDGFRDESLFFVEAPMHAARAVQPGGCQKGWGA